MGRSAQEKVSILRAAISQWVEFNPAVVFELQPSRLLIVHPGIILRALHILQRNN